MRRYRVLAGWFLAFGATAGAKEPTADDALLDWTCSSDNLPRLPAPPVALPTLAGSSVRTSPAEVIYVAANGQRTTARLDGEAGTLVAADQAAPTAAVVDALLGAAAPVHLAFGPAADVEMPPIGVELMEAMGRMCPGGELLPAGLGVAASRCTQYRLPLRDLPGSCTERVALLARVVRACPDQREDVIAYQLCRTHVATEGAQTVMARVLRRSAAALPVAPVWGDAWYGVLAGGLPTDPNAPPVPADAGKPAFVLQQELDPKRHVLPAYPDEAQPLGLGPQSCLATVTLDASGAPTDVVVEGCDDGFHAELERTLLKWTWYAPPRGPARTLLTFRFEMQ